MNEYADAPLGDKRLQRRLVTIAEQFSGQADCSYPEAAGDDAALEATYRFLNNPRVTSDAILAPHIAATADRARGKTLVIAHDTSEFIFRRSEMGIIGEGRVGFLGHFALAVALDDGERVPLGVLGLETIVRSETRSTRPAQSDRQHHARADNEEHRWWRLVEATEPQFRAGA